MRPKDDSATRTLRADAPGSKRIRTYRLQLTTLGGGPQSRDVAQHVLRVGSQEGNDLVLSDASVSRIHFEITVDGEGFRLRDLGSRNGTYVDGFRTWDTHLRPGARIVVGRSTLVFEPLDAETEVPLSAAESFGPLVGRSQEMREVFALLERAARSDVTILIEGETGTGKELVAQAVHGASPRASGPFVVFDCASVPANLMESYLFGHERGAFTGATQRRTGTFEEADGGTLVLDELGELPLELQPKLLRALEAREFVRVGATRTQKVDVRIVAATNRDLAAEVNRGSFRNDLYHRLAVIRVTIPPLRERRLDVRPLVEHFVRRSFPNDAARAEKVLSGVPLESWHRLEAYAWPGNIRELRNVVERSIALAGDELPVRIEPGPLPPPPTPTRPVAAPAPGSSGVDLDRPFIEQRDAILAGYEEAYLVGMLERHGGVIARAAAAAGLDRMYFKRLLRKYRS